MLPELVKYMSSNTELTIKMNVEIKKLQERNIDYHSKRLGLPREIYLNEYKLLSHRKKKEFLERRRNENRV